MNSLSDIAKHAAKAAGGSALSYYGTSPAVTIKNDGSPVTAADRAAHLTIMDLLQSTQIPVVSEEGSDLLLDAERYWLVDPLDGTKNFLAQDGEFTINIALIEAGSPVLGVVHVPAQDELFGGRRGGCAWGESRGIRTEYPAGNGRSTKLRLAASRFHEHPDVAHFAEENDVDETFRIGSALKYCRLAQSQVDVCPRLVGCSEWDTAAGQAVLEAAGGSVIDWHTLRPLRYGKANRRNPRLISFRAPYELSDFKLKHYDPELL